MSQMSTSRRMISKTSLVRLTALRICHGLNNLGRQARYVQQDHFTTQSRSYSSQASAPQHAAVSEGAVNNDLLAQGLLGQRARQAKADKEFFADLISSAATKRDAKAYISRLKSPPKVKPTPAQAIPSKSQVNLGGLFGRSRAVESSPKFTQYDIAEAGLEAQEVLHVALVKISGLDGMSDSLVQGIAQTLSQLARLSMAPCVVVDVQADTPSNTRHTAAVQAERLATAIDAAGDNGARVIENILTVSDSGATGISLRKLLLRPLHRGRVPIIVPTAYSEQRQQTVLISADQAIMALTTDFAGRKITEKSGNTLVQSLDDTNLDEGSVRLDRIIIVNESGGIPSSTAADGKNVFINLAQEFPHIKDQLLQSGGSTSTEHLSNLALLKEALALLPQSSSGLMTTPSEASNISHTEEVSAPSTVGTRRQKNTLIHNLLTDKPAYSSSLPKTRLARKSHIAAPSAVSTFVKRGMPVTILPDPLTQPWTPTSPRIKLDDPSIDLERLVYLIDDSFNRELDIDAYLRRVNDRMAGVIIAGDYEGGAILTWESPPGVDPSDTSRLVPYLDKFAVLKRSQGSGGVADILFNAMVRTCFPTGVCWRSRKDNPVNKWYFERSNATWKIPDMNWTMFWTTSGVAKHSQTFYDYEAVCRGVVPTWIDKKIAAD